MVSTEMNDSRITQGHIADVKRILKKFCGIVLPEPVIVQILQHDDNAAATEIDNFGAYDTTTREIIIDAAMKVIGCDNWPIYGDTKAYKDSFFLNLRDRVIAVGGQANFDRADLDYDV